MNTHDDDGEEQFALEVVELGHLGKVIERIVRVDARLGIQVAVATTQLRRAVLAQTQVLELAGLFQLTLRLFGDPEVKEQNLQIGVGMGKFC